MGTAALTIELNRLAHLVLEKIGALIEIMGEGAELEGMDWEAACSTCRVRRAD